VITDAVPVIMIGNFYVVMVHKILAYGLFTVYELVVVYCCGLPVILSITRCYTAHLQVRVTA